MGKKKHYDLSKLYKIYDEIEKLSDAERHEYLGKMSNAARDEFFAMHRQKIEEDEKARRTTGRLSSIIETLATDRTNYKKYGEPNSDKHIDTLVKDGVFSKEEGEKQKARAKENRGHIRSSLEMEIKENEKNIGKLDPDKEAIAILNKNKIAGIEKAKATRARNKLKKIEEKAAFEKKIKKTYEEELADIETQKRKWKLEKDPYIDGLF